MFNELRSRQLRGWWLVLLVVVPLLAGLLAGWRAAGGTHTAAGRVSVAQVITGEGTSSDEVAQLVALFETEFEAGATSAEVAAATGIPEADLRGRLSAEPLAGGLVEVVHRARGREQAVPALDTATRTTLARIVRGERSRALARAEQSALVTDRLAGSLREVQDSAGAMDVARSFDLLTADVLQLRTDVAAAQVTNPDLARSLQAVLEQKQLEMDRLGSALVQYRRLDGALRQAIDAENTARLEVDRLAQLEATTERAPVLLTSNVVASPQLARAATLAIVAAAASALVMLLVFVLATRPEPASRPARGTEDVPVPVEQAAAR
jgi:hypothetical protein